VYTNVDARPVEDGAAARDALIRQVVAPVRWQETISAMLDDGIEAFVEVGPGKVLSGLVRAIRKGVPTYHAGEPDGLEKTIKELAS
jgi:[acyl-carrier-protein] S-malonyltransferase